MQISQAFQGESLPISFEIFPPKGDLPVEAAHAMTEELAPLDPAFVSVTYSQAEAVIARARSTSPV